MIITHIVAALVEALIFLELSEDDDVDPDAAVTTMESIAGILQEMSPSDRDGFIRQLGVLADAEPNTELGKRRSEFIRNVPGYFGLIDDG